MKNEKASIAENDMIEVAEAVRLFTTRCGFAASAWIVGRIDQAKAEKYIMDDFDALRARIDNIRGES